MSLDADKRPCVLVIDEDWSVVELVRAVLREEGFDSVGTSDRNEALELVQELSPDLFMVDLGWSHDRTAGIDLAQQLRRAGFEQTPMIVISASDSLLPEAARRGPFQGSVPKPFDPDELVQEVKRVLGF